MEIKKQEAFDILNAWRTDQRLVQCGLNVGARRISQILGRVDTVQESFIHISASRLDIPSGDRFCITIPVANIRHYEYVEGHEAPQDYLPNILEERFKGMIGLECIDGLKLAILAFKTSEERRDENDRQT
jgi:hypothetical protein